MLAAELFRAAAEAHGWILISSNDTRSDGPMEPNVKALQAMKGELRPVDLGFVAAHLAEDLARARPLKAQRRWLQALRRFEGAAASFEGLADVAEARREAARVASLGSTKRARKDEERWDRFEEVTRRRLDEAYRKLIASEPPLPLAAFRAQVGIDTLRRHAEAPAYEGVVGRRLLDTLATQTGFYITREFLPREDLSRALTVLAVATEAAPGQPAYWYNLACVQARLGERRQALESLERAVAAGFSDRAWMAADQDLASLREEERFKALVRD